jgi:hypothetical protein
VPWFLLEPNPFQLPDSPTRNARYGCLPRVTARVYDSWRRDALHGYHSDITSFPKPLGDIPTIALAGVFHTLKVVDNSTQEFLEKPLAWRR